MKCAARAIDIKTVTLELERIMTVRRKPPPLEPLSADPPKGASQVNLSLRRLPLQPQTQIPNSIIPSLATALSLATSGCEAFHVA